MISLHGWDSTIIFWGAIVLIVVINNYFSHKNLESRHRMMETLAQKGQPIPPADLPLMRALARQRPAYKRCYIQGLNGKRRHIEVAAIPIQGLISEFLGAAALFWEID